MFEQLSADGELKTIARPCYDQGKPGNKPYAPEFMQSKPILRCLQISADSAAFFIRCALLSKKSGFPGWARADY